MNGAMIFLALEHHNHLMKHPRIGISVAFVELVLWSVLHPYHICPLYSHLERRRLGYLEPEQEDVQMQVFLYAEQSSHERDFQGFWQS